MRAATIIGLVASVITILAFLTGYQNLRELVGGAPTSRAATSAATPAVESWTVRPGQWLALVECPMAGWGDPECAQPRVVERAKELLGQKVRSADIYYDETPTVGPNGKIWTGIIAYRFPAGS